MKSRYLISGATGLVGSRILQEFIKMGYPCVGFARDIKGIDDEFCAHMSPCDLNDTSKLSILMRDIDVVIHCAGYAHSFGENIKESYINNWQTNYDGTKNLLEAASQNRIKKIIFLSSIKAMGEINDCPWDERSPCNPTSEYGKSKLAAERLIQIWGRRSGVEVVILRLAMVYGAGKGNFERMVKLISRGIFPSIPETGNSRSIIHIDDVVSAVFVSTLPQPTSSEIYIVSGDWSPSGRELYIEIRVALGRSNSFISFPAWFLIFLALFCNQIQRFLQYPLPFNMETLDKLLKSSHFSSEKFKNATGWKPVNTSVDSVRAIVLEKKF